MFGGGGGTRIHGRSGSKALGRKPATPNRATLGRGSSIQSCKGRVLLSPLFTAGLDSLLNRRAISVVLRPDTSDEGQLSRPDPPAVK